jgi:trk system potassium uptake protein TrkA
MELLKSEHVDQMDALVAVTGNSETNIISCLSARNQGVKKTIAAVENIDYIHLSQNIGIDTLINRKLIAARLIMKSIRKGRLVTLTNVEGLDAEIMEFEVTDRSKVVARRLRDLHFPKTAIVGGVIRKERGFTAHGDFLFQPRDRVVVLSKKDCIHKVEAFFH